MEINKQCAAYCIDVIRAVMQEKQVPPFPETVTLPELYGFAQMHSVESLVFHGLEQLPMDSADPIWQDWETRAGMLMTQSIVQLAERDLLLAMLPAAGVPLLPVKGCWLKEQYPDIDYRQMSDLDMLIPEKESLRAREVMQHLGYTFIEESGEHHDSYAKPPYMGIELHLSLLPEDDEHTPYYKDVWQRAEAAEGYPGVFRMKTEDEYIFYLVHLYKHMVFAGMGIRSFLDCVVFWKTYPEMDREYLNAEFKKLGLLNFASRVEQIAHCWFESGEPLPDEMLPMAHSILTAGTYGTEDRIFKNELQQLQGKFQNPLLLKMAHLLRCLFLPLKAMQELYPFLKKAPVLLPVFWIWRLISRCIFKPKALISLVKQTNEEGDKIWSEYNWREFQSK